MTAEKEAPDGYRWVENPGPWLTEPDNETWTDPRTGYTLAIRRMPTGHLCGYVAVPKDHPAGGMTDMAWDFWTKHDIEVHGGITYGRDYLAPETEDKSRWWIGFDCNHAWDLAPAVHKSSRSYYSAYDVEYRTWGYTKREVESLAAQLATLEGDSSGKDGGHAQ